MKGYTTTVTYTSKEISKKESIRLKDLTDAISLDAATEGGESLQIKPVLWAVVAVHDESSREKDYNKYVIEDADGIKYVTGSESFWSSFEDIVEEMDGVDEEWSLSIYKRPSKNYAGKGFLTCSVI